MEIKRRTLALGVAWTTPAVLNAVAAPAFAASVCQHTCATLSKTNNTASNPFWFGNDTSGSNADALWNGTGKYFTDGNGWKATSNTPWQNKYRDDDYWNGDARISRVYAWGPSATPTCDSWGFPCIAGTKLTGESVVLFSGDPLFAGQYWTYSSGLICLSPGMYSFAYDYTYLGCYWRTQYMQASMVQVVNGVPSGMPIPMGGQITASSKTNPSTGTQTGMLTVTTDSTWRWTYKWWSNDTDPNASPLPVTNRKACNVNTNDIGVSKPRCTSQSPIVS